MDKGTLNLLICVGGLVAVFLIWGLESMVSSIASRNRPVIHTEDEKEDDD